VLTTRSLVRVQPGSPEQSRTGDREVNAIVRTSDRGHHQFLTHVLSEAEGGWAASVPSANLRPFPSGPHSMLSANRRMMSLNSAIFFLRGIASPYGCPAHTTLVG
jgi:hypothetical protein